MKYPAALLSLLLTLLFGGCAVHPPTRPQEQRGYYHPSVLRYHRLHGQSLRHPQCYRR